MAGVGFLGMGRVRGVHAGSGAEENTYLGIVDDTSKSGLLCAASRLSTSRHHRLLVPPVNSRRRNRISREGRSERVRAYSRGAGGFTPGGPWLPRGGMCGEAWRRGHHKRLRFRPSSSFRGRGGEPGGGVSGRHRECYRGCNGDVYAKSCVVKKGNGGGCGCGGVRRRRRVIITVLRALRGRGSAYLSDVAAPENVLCK